MSSTAHIVKYGGGNIPFQLTYAIRKSLEISVLPDKSVFVKAPIGTSKEAIESRVLKRARWIKKQIRYFEQFDPRTPERKYIGGETHLYLGRRYRLKIELAEQATVRLTRGYFYVKCPDSSPQKIKSLILDWYSSRAEEYLTNVFEDCWKKLHFKPISKPMLKLQKLKKRWGSLSKKGTLTLNLELIKAPRECIEYVVIHELCHLEHHNHGPEFYKLLEQSLPDWMKRKHKLEMAMI